MSFLCISSISKKSIIPSVPSKISIKNWINKDKEIKFNLIFRKSRDGENCSDFHRHCDNQGSTLCLI